MPNIYSHQETWQFMAVDLIASPNTAHTFVYNLKSTLWVLLWITYAYMHTNLTAGVCSSFLKQAMNPRVFGNTGGDAKLNFIQSKGLLDRIIVIKNIILLSFLKDLKKTLAVCHLLWLSLSSHSDYNPLRILAEIHGEYPDGDAGMLKSIKRQIQDFNNLTVGLKDHWLILNLFDKVLKSPNWSDNDEAALQEVLLDEEMQANINSSSKQSKSIAEESGIYVLALHSLGPT